MRGVLVVASVLVLMGASAVVPVTNRIELFPLYDDAGSIGGDVDKRDNRILQASTAGERLFHLYTFDGASWNHEGIPFPEEMQLDRAYLLSDGFVAIDENWDNENDPLNPRFGIGQFVRFQRDGQGGWTTQTTTFPLDVVERFPWSNRADDKIAVWTRVDGAGGDPEERVYIHDFTTDPPTVTWLHDPDAHSRADWVYQGEYLMFAQSPAPVTYRDTPGGWVREPVVGVPVGYDTIGSMGSADDDLWVATFGLAYNESLDLFVLRPSGDGWAVEERIPKGSFIRPSFYADEVVTGMGLADQVHVDGNTFWAGPFVGPRQTWGGDETEAWLHYTLDGGDWIGSPVYVRDWDNGYEDRTDFGDAAASGGQLFSNLWANGAYPADGLDGYLMACGGDLDCDGIADADEAVVGTDWRNADTDGDFLIDGDEILFGTDPLDSDTDGDNGYDGSELNSWGTDPLNPDSDGDGLLDGDEVAIHDTRPDRQDTDGDGLGDGDEVNTYGTDPTHSDSDRDGLSDGDEVGGTTDPLDADSDDDCYSDGLEVERGSDPNDPNSRPRTTLDFGIQPVPDESPFGQAFLREIHATAHGLFEERCDA